MIKFLVCGNVKAPKRKPGDAGFDFFVPEYSDEFKTRLYQENGIYPDGERSDAWVSKEIIYLMPGADIKIPTMVRALIPEDECLRMSNKSGVALKQKLVVGAEIIDSSYEGEMNMHVFNVSNHVVTIEFGQKLVQAVPLKIDPEAYEVEYEMSMSVETFYMRHDHSRGEGGFGSTGLK